MKKRILSIGTAIVLVVVTVGAALFFNQDTGKVFAAEFRDGYIVAPTHMDSAGVALDSAFVFKTDATRDDLTLESLQEALTITPTVEYTLSEQEEGIVITPNQALEPNTTYIFDVDGITWAYRTEADFVLLGNFPRHQSTNVPVNTGIELIFNYEGADVEDYFEIEPEVKGKFEQHGRVLAFVPKELQKQTIYTVTLKAGLPLDGSDKALQEDVHFSFETQADETMDSSSFYMNFQSFMHEFAESEVPSLEWNYYFEEAEIEEAVVDIDVFAYRNVTQFTDHLKDYADVPMWSHYGMNDAALSTSGLQGVMDFEQTLVQDNSYPRFLELPNTLDAGYYLVQATFDEQVIQTFVQVTDLSFYYQTGTDEDIFWVHDLSSQEPINNAKVTNLDNDLSARTNQEGLARIAKNVDGTKASFYHLTAGDKEAVLYNYGSMMEPYRGGMDQNQEYWTYFKPDRNLYKPEDTVNFFGFLQHRYENSVPTQVTVEITQGRYYAWRFIPSPVDELSYVTDTVNVNNGFFEGKLDLPHLSQGGYQLSVKHNGEIIASTYIQVENYVKPSYRMKVEKDQEAIFVGNTLQYTLQTEFFEGTPVSFLDYNYNINGIDYTEGSGTTDAKGQGQIEFRPEYQVGHQGDQHYYFSAYANLPESGNIHVNDYFRVFFNDIHVARTGSIDDEQGTIKVDVHDITLERLNNGTAADEQDFLADPVDNHVVQGTVYRNEWVRTETGEYYDYINKEVKKQYSYDLEKTEFDTFSMTTDSEGHAEYTLHLPEENNVHYSAEVITHDSNNREMTTNVYFGRDREYYPNEGEWYHLETDKENYGLKDQVEISFMNNEELHTMGRYLFITGQNGIKTVDILSQPTYTTTFEVDFVPNIEVKGVLFNGTTYVEASGTNVSYDYTQREIDLKITANASAYRPGDEVQLAIEGTYIDDDGNRQAVSEGVVNISLVDEALLALSDMEVNPLEELYRHVAGGFGMSYPSHMNQNHGYRGYAMGMGGMAQDNATEESAAMDIADGGDNKSSGSIDIRQEFKDTAEFMTVKFDAAGKATLTFDLPDNVTSWRVMAAAISESLNAGSKVENVDVSLPFFLNTSISQTYLVGDEPMIGITGYGNALEVDTMIDYMVSVKKADQIIDTFEATGKAFERANIPLGNFQEVGQYEVTITGQTDAGQADGLMLPIQVHKTYHEQSVSDYYVLNQGTQIVTTDSGDTTLTFTDQGRGQYLPTLYSMAYSGGKRVDQKYLAQEVRKQLNETFNQEVTIDQVDLNEYQTDQGGIAILPYAEADVETSVLMLPMIRDDVNTLMLAKYFENAWYDSGRIEKGAVLYGRTLLDEPVLLDLQTYASLDNLTTKDKLYLGLAYVTIGDTYKAKELYEEAVSGLLEEFGEQVYIQAETDAKSYELTALGMLLASKTQQEVHEQFYTYLTTHFNKDVLIHSHLYQYILDELEGREATTGQVTYQYNGQEKTIVLENGWPQTITIPSATVQQLDIVDVQGDMAVTATYMTDLITSRLQEENVSVTRRYYNYQTGEEQTSFKEGDIVKVVLDWDVASQAIDDSYQLTDYVPSGLKALDNPWQLGLQRDDMYWYREVEDQKVRFYIYKRSEPLTDNEEKTEFSYYARITSLGKYTAESPIIQGVQVKDSMYIGERTSITIE